MLYTGKSTENSPEGFKPEVSNNLGVVKASGAGKFGFWFLTIITLGIFYIAFRVNRMNWLNQQQISINNAASTIDIALEQRFDTLNKLFDSVKGQTKFNKEVYENIAAYRSGFNPNAEAPQTQQAQLQNKTEAISEKQDLINKIYGGLHMQFEQYPTLGADASFSKLMAESVRIENEIAATKRTYNQKVQTFNQVIYTWPTCVLLDKKGYQGLPQIVASVEKRADVKFSF